MYKFSRLNYDQAARKEWWLTNGIGGFAASTLAGANTRRYHGLLVAGEVRGQRRLLWAKAEASLSSAGASFFLSSNEYLGGTVHPRGYVYLLSCEVDATHITRLYQGDSFLFQERIIMVPEDNATLIQYQLLEATGELELTIDPLVNNRGFHEITREDLPFEVSSGPDYCQISLEGAEERFLLAMPGAEFIHEEDWYRHFYYPEEAARGLEDWENHFRPGRFRIVLSPGASVQLKGGILSEKGEASGLERQEYLTLYLQQQKEQDALVKSIEKRWKTKGLDPEEIGKLDPDLWAKLLRLAVASQSFLVKVSEHRDIVAGYPWFTQWGRDSMISLPGLCLVTGRTEVAQEVLLSYAQQIKDGLLPNRVDEHGGADYNTVDAGLWFIISLYEYLVETQDRQFLDQIFSSVYAIISSYLKGTKYQIHSHSTGLLYAGEEGVQLTWMDAKIGDWVVTPRIGFPVEVNALWFNALQIGSRLASQVGRSDLSFRWSETAELVQHSFSREFWNPKLGCLYDLVTPDGKKDPAIRPNQIFAVSLPFPIISRSKASQVVEVVFRELYTPGGLRSLARGDANYNCRYQGKPEERDAAYHQGTIWAWLVGPFIRAYLKVNDWTSESAIRAKYLLDPLLANLTEGAIGHLNEIFEPEYPYEPRGCPLQAWSEAEVLRAYVEDVLPALCKP